MYEGKTLHRMLVEGGEKCESLRVKIVFVESEHAASAPPPMRACVRLCVLPIDSVGKCDANAPRCVHLKSSV